MKMTNGRLWYPVIFAAAAAAGLAGGAARGAGPIEVWNENTGAETAYLPLSNDAKVGDFVYVDARKLHPTQFCLGMREVNYKAGLVSAMNADKSSHDDKASVYAFLAKKDIPIMIGPDGTAYLTDGHHTLAALLASKQADKTAFGHVVGNFFGKPKGDFQAFMEDPKNNDVYLFGAEGNGLSRTPEAMGFKDLPALIYAGDSAGAMKGDVYRSLGWGMKETGYSTKTKGGRDAQILFGNFIEFRWADLFRGKIVWDDASDDAFYIAVANADALAHSKQTRDLSGGFSAENLPGFVAAKKSETFDLNITNGSTINGEIVPAEKSTNRLAINARAGTRCWWLRGGSGTWRRCNGERRGKAEPALEKGDFKPAGAIPAGGGMVVLSGESDYGGETEVHAGVLVVNGAIASGVKVEKGAELLGSGRVGEISGSGDVSPGSSVGILSAKSVDGSGGLSFSFVFTEAAEPEMDRPLNSKNDVLALSPVDAFAGPLTSANHVRVFLRGGMPAAGDAFTGGFFVPGGAAFTDAVKNAGFEYFVADAKGETEFGGFHYRRVDGAEMQFAVEAVQEEGGFMTRFTARGAQASR